MLGNAEFRLKIGWSKKGPPRTRPEMLEFVGLADRAGHYPNQLRAVRAARGGCSCAATNPALLLADESTSALDPETTHEVLALLKRVNRELGVTVVVITTRWTWSPSIADRVAVTESGRVVEAGRLRRLPTRRPTWQSCLLRPPSLAPTGKEAAELRANHKGYPINVEIVEG